MRKLLVLWAILLLTGCATVNHEMTRADGTTIKTSATTVFKTFDAVRADDLNGTLAVKGSQVDAETLQAIIKILGGVK
mgnify:FL=1